MNRHYVKCNDCLTPMAVDLEDGYWKAPTMICGICGGKTSYMGKVYEEQIGHTEMRVPCDCRCTNATGPNCECSCGCVNHGTQRLVEIIKITGQIPRTNNKPNAELKSKVEAWRKEIEELQLTGIYKAQYWSYQAKVAKSWGKRERCLVKARQFVAVKVRDGIKTIASYWIGAND